MINKESVKKTVDSIMVKIHIYSNENEKWNIDEKIKSMTEIITELEKRKNNLIHSLNEKGN